MLKPHGARTRRLDHWSGRLDGASPSDEHTYLVIIGSHRNSCLCIERDGVVAHLVKGEWLPKDAADTFTKYRVSWTADGRISVVVGGPNPHRVHHWRDPEPFHDAKIECVGLSTWDGFTQYRNIRLLGARNARTRGTPRTRTKPIPLSSGPPPDPTRVPLSDADATKRANGARKCARWPTPSSSFAAISPENAAGEMAANRPRTRSESRPWGGEATPPGTLHPPPRSKRHLRRRSSFRR